MQPKSFIAQALEAFIPASLHPTAPEAALNNTTTSSGSIGVSSLLATTAAITVEADAPPVTSPASVSISDNSREPFQRSLAPPPPSPSLRHPPPPRTPSPPGRYPRRRHKAPVRFQPHYFDRPQPRSPSESTNPTEEAAPFFPPSPPTPSKQKETASKRAVANSKKSGPTETAGTLTPDPPKRKPVVYDEEDDDESDSNDPKAATEHKTQVEQTGSTAIVGSDSPTESRRRALAVGLFPENEDDDELITAERPNMHSAERSLEKEGTDEAKEATTLTERDRASPQLSDGEIIEEPKAKTTVKSKKSLTAANKIDAKRPTSKRVAGEPSRQSAATGGKRKAPTTDTPGTTSTTDDTSTREADGTPPTKRLRRECLERLVAKKAEKKLSRTRRRIEPVSDSESESEAEPIKKCRKRVLTNQRGEPVRKRVPVGEKVDKEDETDGEDGQVTTKTTKPHHGRRGKSGKGELVKKSVSPTRIDKGGKSRKDGERVQTGRVTKGGETASKTGDGALRMDRKSTRRPALVNNTDKTVKKDGPIKKEPYRGTARPSTTAPRPPPPSKLKLGRREGKSGYWVVKRTPPPRAEREDKESGTASRAPVLKRKREDDEDRLDTKRRSTDKTKKDDAKATPKARLIEKSIEKVMTTKPKPKPKERPDEVP